jgi:hypothetical protein
MLKQKSLILILLALNLTTSLLVNDFCIRKQKECKGFYDEKQNYKIKCNLIECYGTQSNQCSNRICSKNVTKCDKYNQLESIMKMYLEIEKIYPNLAAKYKEQKNKFYLLNNKIKDCKIKAYKFDSNDYCVNGKNCWTSFGYGLLKTIKQTDCKCLIKLSFKCGDFCTKNSDSCDYKSNNKNKLSKINNCGNQNTNFKNYFSIFQILQ